MYAAVRLSAVPVLLASITTAASFLTNLTSKFEPVADFGIITGIGVLSGWIVMTNYVPACRVWLDRRNVAKGRPLATRAVAETIPGAGPLHRLTDHRIDFARIVAVDGNAGHGIAHRPIRNLLGRGSVPIGGRQGILIVLADK